MAQPDDIKHIVEVITKVAEQYLLDEIGIHTDKHDTYVCQRHELELKPFTVMMEISGCFNLNIVFSFDERLIDKVYQVYCRELNLNDDERLEHIDETASDMINIVIGNSTHLLAEDGTIVIISVPIIISESNGLSMIDVKILSATLYTDFGNMMITAMPCEQDESTSDKHVQTKR